MADRGRRPFFKGAAERSHRAQRAAVRFPPRDGALAYNPDAPWTRRFGPAGLLRESLRLLSEFTGPAPDPTIRP
jgi:hypothetical protein